MYEPNFYNILNLEFPPLFFLFPPFHQILASPACTFRSGAGVSRVETNFSYHTNSNQVEAANT